MKRLVDNLSGWRLDCAVAQAIGKGCAVSAMRGAPDEKMCLLVDGEKYDQYRPPRWFCPSSSWNDGGPLIEALRIGVRWSGGRGAWVAATGLPGHAAEGETPLVAAMRALVKVKFGDRVEA